MEVRAAAAAEQTATYTPGKPLARQVNDYLAATRTSIATLANEIPGYSRPTISRYLAGKYDGDITTIEKLLAEWLAQRTGEAVDVPERPGKTGRKPAFLETRDAVNVLGVCQSCQEYIGLGIVVARSGYGKTYSLRQYAKLPRVAYRGGLQASPTGQAQIYPGGGHIRPPLRGQQRRAMAGAQGHRGKARPRPASKGIQAGPISA